MSIESSFVVENTKSNEDFEKIIAELTESVENLYLFRDHYFENHPMEKATDKENEVKHKLDDTLDSFKKCEDIAISGSKKAHYLYLKGRALNILPKYDRDAEEALSKAVKLEPNLVDAWNELGQCYWKDNNLPEAKNCFNGALPQRKNKISLRNMSIVLRQEVSSTPQEKRKNIEKSVELAKEAVQMDPKDGVSWCVLGNAYLWSFFVIGQDPAILKQCMISYKQATADPVARGLVDLHYNRAVALMYEEEYLQALEAFTKATALDPTWEDPPNEKQKLLTYLDSVSELVDSKGKMKGKKLQQMLQQLDSKQLGPYANGKYTNGAETIKLELCPFKDLKGDVNHEKVIVGKVVCSIKKENMVPFTFCMVDASGTCSVVTVYNLADGRGVIIGDSVAVPEPFVTFHNFSHMNKDYKFTSVRVDNPMVMIVNGKKVGKEQIAGTKIASSYKVS